MNEFDVRRLALVLSLQAEIEGMKAANSQNPQDQPFTLENFKIKASKLQDLAYAHNEQLF